MGRPRNPPSAGRAADAATATAALPVLLVVLLFFGSGAAALIYEVVWLQMLQLVIGASAISLGVLLGTFMGGMCLGSFLLPRLVTTRRHPLRVYAALELATGAIGLLLLAAMPSLGDLYGRVGGGHLIVRVLFAAACLLPPTMMMGATLPVVARWVTVSPAGFSRIGWFYAANLAGAVSGTVSAGFYLLRFFDVAVATYAAAGLNLVVAIGAWWVARRVPVVHIATDQTAPPSPAPDTAWIYLVSALSGFTALSCEVLWTRLLALSFGATVYTFSLILAAFLVGLSAGTGLGALIVRRTSIRPRVALGWCQLLVAVAIGSAAYLLTRAMPYWPIAETAMTDPWRTFQLDLLRSLLVVLPGALLWGASFPLAVASAASGNDPSRLVSRVYVANTAGAIVGSLGTSLLLVGMLGSQHTQQLLIGVAATSGVLAFMTAEHHPRASVRRSSQGTLSTWLWIGVALEIIILVPSVAPVPGVLIAYGRRSAEWAEGAKVVDAGRILYTAEGRNEFVAVSRGGGGEMYYHAAGKVQASTLNEDMRLQLLLAHISHLVPAHPRNVLVIGCGAGITAGALSTGPGVEQITIVDIEPLVPQVAASYFGPYNHDVIRDPRVSVRVDDGRHFLATTNDTFDVITTDLIDPWVKGVAALFTREFFESAKRHLRPGGVVTQFVQLYQSSPEAVQSEIGTFVEAFPNTIIWGNPHEGQGYDLVLLGQVEPLRIDVDDLQARLDSPAYTGVRDSLRSMGAGSAIDLLATFAGSGSDLTTWLRDAPINRDRNLRLQYLAGLGLNLNENGPIYRQMLAHTRFPSATFVGTPQTLQALRVAIEGRRTP